VIKTSKKKKYTPQQLAIIRRNYAIMSEKQKQPQATQKLFKLPLKNGGNRWNIFRVSNLILGGYADGDIHGGLVLDEMNNKVLLVEVTHSAKNGKRNNLEIRNLCSNDLDENGNLRKSFARKCLVVTYKNKQGEQGIDVSALKKQMNDLQFTEQEKRDILDKLSHLDTAEEKYKKFVELANKKD